MKDVKELKQYIEALGDSPTPEIREDLLGTINPWAMNIGDLCKSCEAAEFQRLMSILSFQFALSRYETQMPLSKQAEHIACNLGSVGSAERGVVATTSRRGGIVVLKPEFMADGEAVHFFDQIEKIVGMMARAKEGLLLAEAAMIPEGEEYQEADAYDSARSMTGVAWLECWPISMTMFHDTGYSKFKISERGAAVRKSELAGCNVRHDGAKSND